MMKKIILTLLIVTLFPNLLIAQIEYLEVNSQILQDNRLLSIQKPKNYNPDTKKTYPLIFVFDGDYLFDPVASMVKYLSYWEEIPEAFVVGIMQGKKRIKDGKFDQKDFLPIGSGAQFFDFLQLEVFDNLKENYNIGDFIVAVGHDYMANFMNLFMFSDKVNFKGYVNLSPDIPNDLVPFIKTQLENSKDKTWYTIATGSEDIPHLQKKAKNLYDALNEIDKEKLSLSLMSFNDTNHYTFVGYAIPFGLSKIFSTFTPINTTEYEEVLTKAENPVTYLSEKYASMNALYDINTPIRISDIMKVAKVIEESEKWELYEQLSKIAKENHGETLLYDYFLGRFYQEIGKPKKAMRAYKTGYTYKEAGGITQDMLLEKAQYLKETFGY